MKKGIFGKMMLGILVPAFLTLCAVTLLSYHFAKKYMTHLAEQDMAVIVDRQTSELDNMVHLVKESFTSYAKLSEISNFIQRYNTYGAKDSEHTDNLGKMQNIMRNLVESVPILTVACLVAADGTVIAHNKDNQLYTSRSHRQYFRDALDGKPGCINAIAATSKLWAHQFGIPVRDKNNRVIGAIVGVLNVEKLASETIKTIRFGDTGIAAIYESSGRVLAHPDPQLVGEDQRQTPEGRAIFAEGNGFARIIGEDGVTRLAAFRSIPAIGWHVAVFVEERDVLYGASQMLFSNLIVGFVAVLLVGSLILVIARHIAGPLAFIGKYMRGIDGTTDPTPEDEAGLERLAKRKDEVGRLAVMARDSVCGLREMFAKNKQAVERAEAAGNEAQKAMLAATEALEKAERSKREGMLEASSRIKGVVEQLSTSSAKLSEQIEQSERASANAASRLISTAVAIEEMSASIAKVADNAEDVSRFAATVSKRAREGAGIVSSSADSTRKVSEVTTALQNEMEDLRKYTSSISDIMGIISDIADQTNLLALNAAIEAARAGDAGRGFAVVADEVRKLAEKTMDSTSEVAKVVASIQTSMNRSTSVMETAITYVEKSVTLSSEAGETLDAIVSDSEKSSRGVSSIAHATEQQISTGESINKDIQEVNAVVSQTSYAMQESAKAIALLAKQAQELSSLVIHMESNASAS